MGDATAVRAAVLAANEGGHADSRGSWHVRADGGCRTNLALVVLPPGRRAAELGRSLLGFPHGPEWEAAGLGEPRRVETEVPNWAAELLFWAGRERHDGRERIPGPIDVPVVLDHAAGQIVVDAQALERELAPLRDEGVKLWKANESPLSSVRKVVSAPKFMGRFAGSFVKEWKDALGDLKSGDAPPGSPRPDDATHPPVEGVGYDHWVRVRAQLARDEVHPSHVDLYTHYRHIPWQRWATIDAAWSARLEADPQLAAWARHDLARLKPTGAT